MHPISTAGGRVGMNEIRSLRKAEKAIEQSRIVRGVRKSTETPLMACD